LLGRSKTPKRRKNRYKKPPAQSGPRLMHRLLLAVKLGGLLTLLLVVSALFVLGYAAVTRSDFFRTRSIVVDGLSRLTRETVLLQAGLSPGDNLLAINLHLVRKRLLGHPWIAGAQVTREIPETIGIHIQEQHPLAIVDMGRRFLINAQGRIFKELGSGDPQRLPVIRGIRYTDISLGEDALSKAMQAVVEVLNRTRNAKGTFAYDQLEALDYDPELGVALVSRDSSRVCRLGFAPFEAKFSRLAQLVPRLNHTAQWRDYQAVDVNNPDRIVVQLNSNRTSRGGA
jgi:cell division protein FtsQ